MCINDVESTKTVAPLRSMVISSASGVADKENSY